MNPTPRLPIVREFSTSLDTVDIFERFREEDHSFFLDSGLREGKLGRCSYMGSNPFLIFRSKGRNIEVIEGGRIRRFQGNPFRELKGFMERYPATFQPELPPFQCGAVGYFGYDLSHFIEKLPSQSVDDLGLPDCYFCFYDTVLVFDHESGKSYIISHGFPEEDRRRAEAKASLSMETMEEKLAALTKGKYNLTGAQDEMGGCPLGSEVEFMFTQKDYEQIVQRAKEYIRAGDIYEVNLSHRISAKLEGSPWELYRRLRDINPAPFASFLNFEGVKVVSASPERLLKIIGRRAQCRPMKGTRPRGKNPEEDLKLRKELAHSEKDLAENLMIVDLLRNDLGRVCNYGTVEVTEFFVIEQYATVFQMVSTIEGELASGYDRFDCIRACFPGGSMTGAPKIRAMEIIDELEPVRRGIYSGSIGYLGFDGNLDLNIVIRTFIVKDKKLYFQVGGAVVADSDPESEYRETLDKAQALMTALRPQAIARSISAFEVIP